MEGCSPMCIKEDFLASLEEKERIDQFVTQRSHHNSQQVKSQNSCNSSAQDNSKLIIESSAASSDHCSTADCSEDGDSYVKHARLLQVRFRLGVYEVDAVAQIITFSLKLFCKWQEAEFVTASFPRQCRDKQPQYEDIDAAQLQWKPTFYFENLMEKNQISEHYSIRRHTGTVIGAFDFVLKIREILELHRFPFDRQLLKLDICSKCTLQPWTVDPLIIEPSYVVQDTTCAGFYNPLWELERYEAHLHNDSCMLHRLSIRLFASRNPLFYVINFGLVNFLIIVLSMTTTAVPNQNFAERASITMTLLLTSIAFKFIITSYVPPTRYMTLLDRYILIGLFVLGAVAFENYIVSFLSQEEAVVVDEVVCSLIFSGWFVFHVFIFVAARSKWLLKDWTTVLEEDDREQTFSSGIAIKYESSSQQLSNGPSPAASPTAKMV